MASIFSFIPPVQAVSFTQWLNCNAFSSTYNGWTALGSSPYLNAIDASIISTSTNNAQEGWFNFEDTSYTGTLVLNISIYCSQSGGTNNWATVYADYTGSGSGSSAGDIAMHTNWQYDTLIPGAKSATDVNNLRVYFQYVKSGNARTITIDHARIGVRTSIYSVNAGGPYVVGGTISVTWTNYPNGNFLTAGENYLNVEYFDQTLAQSLAVHSLDKTASSDTYGPIASAQGDHDILVYVYTCSSQTGDRNSFITRGDPWPATCFVDIPTRTINTKDFALIDEDSKAIVTGETTLATISTSFSAGNNFVLAIVEFQSTVNLDPAISAGNLRLTKSGTSLRTNAYPIILSSSDPHKQNWYALMAFDSAGANPSYDVRATAQGTGVSGEAKILAISGLTGTSTQGSSTYIGTAATTLATLSTSLPVGDNVIIAIVECINDGSSSERYLSNSPPGGCRLNRQSSPQSALAAAQFYLYLESSSNPGRWHVQLIPYLDTGASASPTYNVTCTADQASAVHGRATIVAFSAGSFSAAAYSDGGSSNIGTTETTVNALSTSFSAGSDVAVIASEQFWNMDPSNLNPISAGLNKLQQNGASGGQSKNQYTIIVPLYSTTVDDNGKGFGLLNVYISTPSSSPEYEVKATRSGSSTLNGEAKILALAKPHPVPEFPIGALLPLLTGFTIFAILKMWRRLT